MTFGMTHRGASRIAAGLIEVGAEDFAPCDQRSDCERIIRRGSFERWPGGRRMPTRAGGFCRWLRSETAWTEARGRRSGAKIGGMDRQTLRDWVHRFNGSGPEGLIDNGTEGPKPRLSAEQRARFAQIVEAGPDREKNGGVALGAGR